MHPTLNWPFWGRQGYRYPISRQPTTCCLFCSKYCIAYDFPYSTYIVPIHTYQLCQLYIMLYVQFNGKSHCGYPSCPTLFVDCTSHCVSHIHYVPSMFTRSSNPCEQCSKPSIIVSSFVVLFYWLIDRDSQFMGHVIIPNEPGIWINYLLQSSAKHHVSIISSCRLTWLKTPLKTHKSI